jgi:hypothetical protein
MASSSAAAPAVASTGTLWSLKNLRGEVVWSGDGNSAPKSQQLLKLFVDNCASASEAEQEEFITSLATQITLFAPLKAVPILLTLLSCVHNQDTSNPSQIDVSYLGKGGAKTKKICGLMFKKGDLVWTCQTCGKDPTCVQCDACFRDSDHAGHEVYFHRSMGSGGCCDCGDPEAWAESGNCSLHGHKQCKHAAGDSDEPSDYDPLSTVPPLVLKGMRPVLQGLVGLLASYSTAVARGFAKFDQNSYVRMVQSQFGEDVANIKLVAKLHNDDIHTFDDVTGALLACGLDATVARRVTEDVDAKGECVIPVGAHASVPQLRSVYNVLTSKGLLFSVIPEAISMQDTRLVVAVTWLHQMGTTNDGLQRLVGSALMTPVNALLPVSSCVSHVFDNQSTGDSQWKNPLDESLAPNNIFRFQSENEFPTIVQHLPTVKPPVVAPASSSSSAAAAADIVDDFKPFIQPFLICPQVAFAVAMTASPYYSKAMKKALNNIIIVFQKDWIFKSSFSQLLTILYPAIYSLYITYVGSEEGSVLETTVQVYTANSIVRMLSSDGVNSRILQQNNTALFPPVHISRVIVDTLRTCLYHCGAGMHQVSTGFLTHSAVEKNRLSHVFRDLDYIFENPISAVHVLRGARDPGTVRCLAV